MANLIALLNVLFATVSFFGCPGYCKNEPRLPKGALSSGSIQVYHVWPKTSTSGQEWTRREGFPWTSCNRSHDNRKCPGLRDYLEYFCGEGVANLTSAEMENGTVVLHLQLMPGVHNIQAPRHFTCRQDLVIEGSGATILETEPDPVEDHQEDAALNFVRCNGLRIEGIKFRTNGVGNYEHFIGSVDSQQIEVQGCVFETLNAGFGALTLSAQSVATSISIIDCQFQIQDAEHFYPFDLSKPSVSVSLTATTEKNKDGGRALSHMKVLRSSFVFHLLNGSYMHQRKPHRTWTM